MPKIIAGNFYCYGNNLTSLLGMPKIIAGDFYCFGNNLTSLLGMPNSIDGNFDCSENNLTSLEGMPNVIIGDFDCSGNNLISIIGIFDNVEGEITCDYRIYPYYMEARDYREKNPDLSEVIIKIRMYEQTKCEYYLTQKEYEHYFEKYPEHFV